jgi:hypothetical protein
MPENGSFEPVCNLGWNSYGTSGDITTIAKEQMDILKVEFPPILDRVKRPDSIFRILINSLMQ